LEVTEYQFTTEYHVTYTESSTTTSSVTESASSQIQTVITHQNKENTNTIVAFEVV
jgi:hypothetical protein